MCKYNSFYAKKEDYEENNRKIFKVAKQMQKLDIVFLVKYTSSWRVGIDSRLAIFKTYKQIRVFFKDADFYSYCIYVCKKPSSI